MTFQLCISSAIGNSALFQHIEEKMNIPKGIVFLNVKPTNLYFKILLSKKIYIILEILELNLYLKKIIVLHFYK